MKHFWKQIYFSQEGINPATEGYHLPPKEKQHWREKRAANAVKPNLEHFWWNCSHWEGKNNHEGDDGSVWGHPQLAYLWKMRSSLPKILPYRQQITQPCYHRSTLQLLQEDKVGSNSKTMFKARYRLERLVTFQVTRRHTNTPQMQNTLLGTCHMFISCSHFLTVWLGGLSSTLNFQELAVSLEKSQCWISALYRLSTGICLAVFSYDKRVW